MFVFAMTRTCFLFLIFRSLQYVFNEHFFALGLKKHILKKETVDYLLASKAGRDRGGRSKARAQSPGRRRQGRGCPAAH